jgi:predicted nucleic acid-binding protein
MHLALADLFQGRWTNHIHEEWIRNVLKDKPYLKNEHLQKIRQLMDENTRDCLIDGYEPLINELVLPDPNDRHVLAAAIHASASVIVTFNVKDFPDAITNKYNIEAKHPDDFISQLLEIAPGIICGVIKRLRIIFKNPTVSGGEYLEILEKQSLPKTVKKLREFVSLI